MRALIVNGRFLTRPPTGVDRFALELLAALARLRPERLKLDVVVSPSDGTPRALPGGLATRTGGIGSGHLWEQCSLPGLARDQPLVNLCNSAPMLCERQLVVVHDAATRANPKNFSVAFRSWYRLMLGAVARRARVLATVSRFSAAEISHHFGVPGRRLEIIGEGGEHILREPADASVIERLGLRERRFVLAVGSASPNKNFAAVLRAIELLGDEAPLFVATGGGNSRVFAGTRLDEGRVIRAGYVSDAQLRALYEHAECFVFPSYYEGFGLPPLEAMCCGCPVIVSDRASLPEVCADAALYCDPDDPATLAQQLRRVLGSQELRAALREAGRRRAAELTWDRAARQFDEIVAHHFA